MSLLNYWFDSEFFQRRDIEHTREAQALMGSQLDATSDDLASLRSRVTELSATLQALMQVLHDTQGLDVDALTKRIKTMTSAPPPALGPCAKCGQPKDQSQMIHVGAEWWCRDCMRNP